MHRITPPPPLQCRSLPQEGIAGEEPRPLKMCNGVSVGNLGANLTAAAVVYQHTARCLHDFASNPDLGMKRFAASALAKSRLLLFSFTRCFWRGWTILARDFFCMQFLAVVTATASGAANAMNAIPRELHQPGR